MDKLSLEFIQNQYEKIRLLKESDKGKIWLVSDTTGDLFILKHINYTGLPLKALKDHPCEFWPKIILFGEDTKQSFTIVVEEYINGKLLSELNNEQPLSIEKIHDLFRSFCGGLKKLHKLGIIHRDIKPSNIVIKNNLSPVLIDFDSARVISDTAKQNDTILLGTKGFAPPEQFGYGTTDIRSDIYALGITFEGLLPKEYSGVLRTILKKCHAFDPDVRYQTVDSILRDLAYRQIRLPIAGMLFFIVLLTAALVISRHSLPAENPLSAFTNATINQMSDEEPENSSSLKPTHDKEITEKKSSDNEAALSADKNAPGSQVYEEKPSHSSSTYNFIDMKINGQDMPSVTVPLQEYSTWNYAPLDIDDGLFRIFIFPENWIVEVVFTNNSSMISWENPTIDIEYSGGLDIEASETISLPTIAPGEAYTLRYSLGGKQVRARIALFGKSGYGGSADITFRPRINKAANVNQSAGGITESIHFMREL